MNTGTFTFLAALIFVGIIILMLAPIVIISIVVLHIRKRSAEQANLLRQQAMERAREKERLVQEELNLKKMKYRRVRCAYCDSLNPYGELQCSGCGASLKGAKEVTAKNPEFTKEDK